MYLDPIYWIMDNSSLRLLEEQWREKKKERKERKWEVKWMDIKRSNREGMFYDRQNESLRDIRGR